MPYNVPFHPTNTFVNNGCQSLMCKNDLLPTLEPDIQCKPTQHRKVDIGVSFVNVPSTNTFYHSTNFKLLSTNFSNIMPIITHGLASWQHLIGKCKVSTPKIYTLGNEYIFLLLEWSIFYVFLFANQQKLLCWLAFTFKWNSIIKASKTITWWMHY